MRRESPENSEISVSHQVGTATGFWRSHFAENPVARLVWGIEPRSMRRRRKALLAFLLPIVTYYILLCIPMIAYELIFPRRGGPFIISTFYGGFVGATIFPIYWYWAAPNSKLFLMNAEQFLVSNLNPSQIVIGFSSPHLLGVTAISFLHLAVPISVINVRIFDPHEDAFITLLGLTLPVVTVLCAAFWDVARSYEPRARLTRAATIWIAGPLSSPLLLALAISFFGADDDILNVGLWLELASWPLRIWVVARAWRKLLRKQPDSSEI